MWVPPAGNSGVPLAGNTPTSNVFTANNQIPNVSYDTAGNQTGINGSTATYDGENRMLTVTETPAFGGGAETLSYDGGEQRVIKALPSGTTYYIYDAFGQLSAEYAPSYSTLSKEYIRFGGQTVAIQNAATGAACATCYLSYDYLGSVRLVTDQNAKVIARHDYLPFGEEIPSGYAGRSSQFGATDNVSQRFTGQFRDTETGEDYFNARYFGAALGRLTSPDPMNAGANPADPQTWNAYAYVRNSPLVLTDPTGRNLVSPVDDLWDGSAGASCFMCGGGGGGGAIVDGVQTALGGLGSNALAACPNNFCNGFGTNLEGQSSYVQFRASAGSGPSGYQSIPEMSTYNYDSGRGQFLNATQFNQSIQSAVNSQRVALAAAVASKSALSYDTVYAELAAQTNTDGSTMVDGGNVQFGVVVDPLDPNSSAVAAELAALVAAGDDNRTAGAPSIHLHASTGFYHLDTMSPYPILGLGLIVHFGVDVLAGTLFYGPAPIPR